MQHGRHQGRVLHPHVRLGKCVCVCVCVCHRLKRFCVRNLQLDHPLLFTVTPLLSLGCTWLHLIAIGCHPHSPPSPLFSPSLLLSSSCPTSDCHKSWCYCCGIMSSHGQNNLDFMHDTNVRRASRKTKRVVDCMSLAQGRFRRYECYCPEVTRIVTAYHPDVPDVHVAAGPRRPAHCRARLR